MYESCLTTCLDDWSHGWGSRRIFERFLTSTLANLGLITTPRGGYVLENFSIKRRLAQKRLSSVSIFKKMQQDFLKKQNHRGSARQIFFCLLVEKTLKKVATYTHAYNPFTAKTAHFRQRCQGKSCMWFVWRIFEMHRVMVGAADEYLKGFWKGKEEKKRKGKEEKKRKEKKRKRKKIGEKKKAKNKERKKERLAVPDPKPT